MSMDASSLARRPFVAALACAFLGGVLAAGAAAASPQATIAKGSAPSARFVPHQLLIRFTGGGERTYRLPAGADPVRTAARLASRRGVDYAAPNYIAHAAGRMIPDDPGSSGESGGWTADQWNFLGGPGGISVPRAWARLDAHDLPGGADPGPAREPVVAVLDTGIAYTDSPPFERSPDFRAGEFVPGHDFVDDDAEPADENGHGTHIAGTIAAQVDDGVGFTGIAYGVRLMPVRVLDESGAGTAETISNGIRWAVREGADIVNLSLEFDAGVTSCAQVPGVCQAIAAARAHRVAVIAAAGNGGIDGIGDAAVAFPAREGIAVGATTVRGCLARYSNYGEGLDFVGPGGGRDALLSDSQCQPLSTDNPDIIQLSFAPGGGFTSFAPLAEHGTSMAAAHVTGVAALVLATRQLNRHGHTPTVKRLEAYLASTSRPIGDVTHYGAGLISASRAVRPKRG
jgi:serine protease